MITSRVPIPADRVERLIGPTCRRPATHTLLRARPQIHRVFRNVWRFRHAGDAPAALPAPDAARACVLLLANRRECEASRLGRGTGRRGRRPRRSLVVRRSPVSSPPRSSPPLPPRSPEIPSRTSPTPSSRPRRGSSWPAAAHVRSPRRTSRADPTSLLRTSRRPSAPPPLTA